MIAQEDFDALLANPTKEVRGNVIWTRDREELRPSASGLRSMWTLPSRSG